VVTATNPSVPTSAMARIPMTTRRMGLAPRLVVVVGAEADHSSGWGAGGGEGAGAC
jgi:hypothetical protein